MHHFDQLRLANIISINDNATTNESETSGSRRLSEDYIQENSHEEEEEELTITAEEIERLMVFDMMRQNFKLDDKIGASSFEAAETLPEEEADGSIINNNTKEPLSDSAEPLRKQLAEIKLTNVKQTNLLSFFGPLKQLTVVETASYVP